jgi:hypothetical protein
MELKKTEQKIPRYEFRSFGQDFEMAHYRMSRLSEPVPEEYWNRKTNEIYIISTTNNANNIKVRDGKIEIKTLIRTINNLEQWDPLLDGEFPVSSESLLSIFQALNVKAPMNEKSSYTFIDFKQIIQSNPYLQTIRVEKERQGYLVNDTICEYAKVWINGALVKTISSESSDIEKINKTITQIGLTGVENINYLEVIKRVTGMVEKPLAN